MKIVKRLIPFILTISLLVVDVQAVNLTCGVDTFVENDVCLCMNAADCTTKAKNIARELQYNIPKVYIAGIIDTTNTYHWAEEIFAFTVDLLNNHNDGWHDEIFDDGTVIEFEVANADCDETTAARAYWDLRIAKNGLPVHGVVGARCSGASIAIARIAGLEGIPQVSPVSTSSRLSDGREFPFFSRLVAPDDARGEVGAVVSMLREFGWDRVSILSTDTQYARDIATEFRQLWAGAHLDESGELLWEGEVAYPNTITFDDNGDLDYDSVRRVLEDAPTDDPTINSRVILLAAHEEHAYRILEIAASMGFQPDTVWVGLSWVGLKPPSGSSSWLPEFPGFLGVAPFRNENDDYGKFLNLLQDAQKVQGRVIWEKLDHYAIAYMVDSIVSLATALSLVPVEDRRNGTVVTTALRSLTLDGVSGPVSFTTNGDRHDPQYTILNYQNNHNLPDGSFIPDGGFTWKDVGSTGVEINSALLTGGIGSVCFAAVGCGGEQAPSDNYPVPKDKGELWVKVVVPIILVLLGLLGLKYWRSRHSLNAMMESMTEMQKKMEELKRIDDDLLGLDQDLDKVKKKKDILILERGALQKKPDTWCDSGETRVEVLPDDDQYWVVTDSLQQTMKDAHISKLWRIQNTSLWSYYSFHKSRLAMNGVDSNERSVWHGTSGLDPATIYNDRQDGFMMQYSSDGFWG